MQALQEAAEAATPQRRPHQWWFTKAFSSILSPAKHTLTQTPLVAFCRKSGAEGQRCRCEPLEFASAGPAVTLARWPFSTRYIAQVLTACTGCPRQRTLTSWGEVVGNPEGIRPKDRRVGSCREQGADGGIGYVCSRECTRESRRGGGEEWVEVTEFWPSQP